MKMSRVLIGVLVVFVLSLSGCDFDFGQKVDKKTTEKVVEDKTQKVVDDKQQEESTVVEAKSVVGKIISAEFVEPEPNGIIVAFRIEVKDTGEMLTVYGSIMNEEEFIVFKNNTETKTAMITILELKVDVDVGIFSDDSIITYNVMSNGENWLTEGTIVKLKTDLIVFPGDV